MSGKKIHRELYEQVNFDLTDKWYTPKTEWVAKILCDFEIQGENSILGRPTFREEKEN